MSGYSDGPTWSMLGEEVEASMDRVKEPEYLSQSRNSPLSSFRSSKCASI